MKILIAEKIVSGTNYKREWKEAMESIAGQWIDVETDHLFENQYNVTTPSGKGLRIMQDYVRGIEDDVRSGKGKCRMCFHVAEHTGSRKCPKCNQPTFKAFETVETQHTVDVNRNWKIMYSTICGNITPYGYAQVDIMNVKTGEVIKAQSWQYWSSLQIEKNVPQVVKNALRQIFDKYNMGYRNIWVTSLTEKTW